MVTRVEQVALHGKRTPEELAEAGSLMGIKRGSREMYFVFSALWFQLYTLTTFFIATEIDPARTLATT